MHLVLLFDALHYIVRPDDKYPRLLVKDMEGIVFFG